MQTDFAQSAKDGRPAVFLEAVGCLVHLFERYGATLWTGFCEWGTRHIVLPVNNAGFVAVQVRTVAGESNKVTHSGAPLPLLYSRGSETQPAT